MASVHENPINPIPVKLLPFSSDEQYKMFKIRVDCELKSAELTKMLFLCRDTILPKTLDTCEAFIHLASLLEEKMILSSTDTLIMYELLVFVRRSDLAEQLLTAESKGRTHGLKSSSFFSTFR